jgi:DNA-binding GntR family transcriptional regulator
MEDTLPLIRGGHFVNVERYTATNAAFREYIVGLARSESLGNAYRRLAIPGIIARTLLRSDVADAGLVDDHRELVEAYEREDLAGAKEVIVRHTECAKRVHSRAAETANKTSRGMGVGNGG